MPILIQNTHDALNGYFEHNTIASKPTFASERDIVIHFRCGDILSAGGKEYGFMTIKYFEKALDIIKNDLNVSIDEGMSIYFLSQLGTNSLRPDELLGEYNLERKNVDGCNVIAHGMVKGLEQMYAPSKVLINGNNPM